MKPGPSRNSSFIAKMVLLFALLFFAQPDRKEGLIAYLNQVVSGFSPTGAGQPAVAPQPTAQIRP